MRILSLGIGLPDPQIDNYDWATSLSFFDYDAIVVDPVEAISKLVETVPRGASAYTTYAEEPIEDGPTSASAVGLADLLRRRRDETEKLLAKGGMVVCFAFPDVAHPRVAGFTGAHRYYWLPAPTGRDYGSTYLKPASGNQLSVTDYESPFADLLESVRNSVLYRAVFAEGPNGFGSDAHVLARSPGGAAVALELSLGGGKVVFLPALPDSISASERSGFAGKLVTALRNALLLQADERPPSWLAEQTLPGIAEAKTKLDEAEAKIDEAEAELDEARIAYTGIDRYRRLLWQEGKYGLDLPVRDALSLLGLRNLSSPDEPATFSYAGETVLVETQGDLEAVGMAAHYRLRQRIEARIVRDSSRPRGVIVINGYRDQEPEQRPQQYEDSLRVAAESMRYCIIEASQLFEAVRSHLEGRGDDDAFCQRLIDSEGVFVPPEPSPPPVEAAPEAVEQEVENA